jgi:RNA polymerase sigma-70 factor (ECF subfamily)
MEFFPFDDDYVRRLREGDRWTEEHFRSYFEQLLLIKLRRRLPSLEAIHDVRQEVFVRVFKTLRGPGGGLRDARKLGAYVNTVCNNVVLEQYRQGNRTEPLLDAHLDVPTSEDVENALVSSEERERVRRVVDELPPRDRKILKALFFDERSNDDVCAEFGVDRGYLRVLLHRAKEKFREAWTSEVVPIRSGETKSPKRSLPN